MSALNALRAAQAVGMVVQADGTDLLLVAPTAPPAAILDDLKRHKSEIIAILRQTDSGLSADDLIALFDERAGMIEFDGGQPREVAELQAIGSCVLDPAMAETSSAVLEGFVRSLPAHIGRTRSSLVSDEHKNRPGGRAGFSETTS